MTSIAAGSARPLAGDLRISGSVLRGTRTEWLPFPCHPRSHAFLADLDPTMPVQYWEQPCGAEGCGVEYRFEHRGRQIRWHPIVGLTDAGSPPAVPLDRYEVEARLRRETAIAYEIEPDGAETVVRISKVGVGPMTDEQAASIRTSGVIGRLEEALRRVVEG